MNNITANHIHGHSFVVEAWTQVNGLWRLKWVDFINNLVTNEGLDEMLQRIYKSAAFTAADKVLITAGTPVFAAGDTMAAHAGWTEVTAYTEAARPAFTPGTVAAQSVDNAGNKAVFTVNANGTVIGGAAIVTNNTKGGSTGLILGGGAFSAGNKTIDSGDILNVTVTATAASA